jgi:hypothetical protein
MYVDKYYMPTSCIGYVATATASGLVVFDAASGNIQARCAVWCTEAITETLLKVSRDLRKA